MRKSLIAITIIGALAALAVALAPRLAAGIVKDAILDEAAARDLDVRIGGLTLGWQTVELRDTCLHAPAPNADHAVGCVDVLKVDIPVVRAARGDVELQGIAIDTVTLQLQSSLGTLDEIRAMFAPEEDTPDTETPDAETPSPAPTNAAVPQLPPITIDQIHVDVTGQPAPLDTVTIANIAFAPLEGSLPDYQFSVEGSVALGGLRVVEIPMAQSLPDSFDLSAQFATADRWSLEVTTPTPVQFATPASMGGVRAAFDSVRLQAPHTATVGGLIVHVAPQDAPVFQAESATLELRALTTDISELFMARASLNAPQIHLTLDAAGTPLIAPTPAPAETDEPGDAPEPVAADEPPGVWDDRIWWEKIPQRIDVTGGQFTVERQGESATTLALENVDFHYALRAIRTHAEIQLTGALTRDQAAAGDVSVDVHHNWANGATAAHLDLNEIDIGAIAHAAGWAWLDSGELDFELAVEEAERAIPTFDGGLALRELRLTTPLLQAPLNVDSATFDWVANMSREERDGIPARALAVQRGDGTLNDARFTFTPIIEQFDYESPYLGERFDIRFGVPDQPAQALFDAIPSSLLGELVGTEMRGNWGMDIRFPIVWTALEDGGRGIDIDQSSELEVRDANLHLSSLPRPVDVRRLNEAMSFTIDLPNVQTAPVLSIAAPVSEDSTVPADWARLTDISYYLTAATLYREDGRFFTNRGINWFQWRAVLEEAFQARALGRGASTVSMQLVKNVFLSHERTVERKLQELFLTYWMTRLVPKDRILEVYFNIIEWGPGINGIVQAADHYFGVRPSALSLEQAVWLSSIVPAPVRRGRQRANGVASDWSVRHCNDIMTGMANRDWITEGELLKGTTTEIRFVTAEEEAPELPSVQPFDPTDLNDLRVAPVGPSQGRVPLSADPNDRLRVLISGQLPLRP